MQELSRISDTPNILSILNSKIISTHKLKDSITSKFPENDNYTASIIAVFISENLIGRAIVTNLANDKVF